MCTMWSMVLVDGTGMTSLSGEFEPKGPHTLKFEKCDRGMK
jgi:hypothetical protein